MSIRIGVNVPSEDLVDSITEACTDDIFGLIVAIDAVVAETEFTQRMVRHFVASLRADCAGNDRALEDHEAFLAELGAKP